MALLFDGKLMQSQEPIYSEPLQTPVTLLDLERGPCVDMALPLADPCPSCGAFRMQVGAWVCYGVCDVCIDEAYLEAPQ